MRPWCLRHLSLHYHLSYQSLLGCIVFHLQKWNKGKKEIQLELLLGAQFKKIAK